MAKPAPKAPAEEPTPSPAEEPTPPADPATTPPEPATPAEPGPAEPPADVPPLPGEGPPEPQPADPGALRDARLQSLVIELRGERPERNPAAWVALAGRVLDRARAVFSQAQPLDQLMSGLLHSLGQTIDAAPILGMLAMRAVRQGPATALDPAMFEAIIDGHQDTELRRIGVQPLEILPLVIAIAWLGENIKPPEQAAKP